MQNMTEDMEDWWRVIRPTPDMAGTGALAMGAGRGPIEPNDRGDSIAA
jgi:hypothetical protein